MERRRRAADIHPGGQREREGTDVAGKFNIVARWNTERGAAAKVLRTIMGDAAAARAAFQGFGVFERPWPGFGLVDGKRLELLDPAGAAVASRPVHAVL